MAHLDAASAFRELLAKGAAREISIDAVNDTYSYSGVICVLLPQTMKRESTQGPTNRLKTLRLFVDAKDSSGAAVVINTNDKISFDDDQAERRVTRVVAIIVGSAPTHYDVTVTDGIDIIPGGIK